MISIDFDGEKFSYQLILSLVCLLTFNLFKRQLYDTNDRLRLHFYKKKTRLTMIDGGDEYAQNNKGGSLRHY